MPRLNHEFVIGEKREVIEIRGPDDNPFIIKERHLAVKESGLVFEDPYTDLKQSGIVPPGDHPCGRVVVMKRTWKKKAHVDPRPGSMAQDTSEPETGDEVGCGHPDLFSALLDPRIEKGTEAACEGGMLVYDPGLSG